MAGVGKKMTESVIRRLYVGTSWVVEWLGSLWSQCWGHGFGPRLGRIPHAAQYGQTESKLAGDLPLRTLWSEPVIWALGCWFPANSRDFQYLSLSAESSVRKRQPVFEAKGHLIWEQVALKARRKVRRIKAVGPAPKPCVNCLCWGSPPPSKSCSGAWCRHK